MPPPSLTFVVMHRAAQINLAVALILLTGLLLVTLRPGPWALEREKGFMVSLANSLYHLDEAKQQWAIEKNKSELEVPTFDELRPYLGNQWWETIQRLKALGIQYKITSTAEPQSDLATLTRDLRFRRGYCLFYRAGTTYGLLAGWAYPPASATSRPVGVLWVENNLDHLLEAALVILVVGNLLVFVVKRNEHSKQESNHDVSARSA